MIEIHLLRLVNRVAAFLASSAILGCAISANASRQIVDGIVWTYIVSNGEASVGDGNFSGIRAVSRDTTGSVVIPSELGGCPVTGIRDWAFTGCAGISSITIPASVKWIGVQAFDECSGLGSVYIEDLDSWCRVSFAGNNSNPCWNSHHLFLNGEEVTTLVIPDGMTNINNCAFVECRSLTSVEIPDSVTSIGSESFSWCRGLTSITIPGSVTSIGDGAFNGCSGLTSVLIPPSVTNLDIWAFERCWNIETLYLADSFSGDLPDPELGQIGKRCTVVRYETVPLSVVSDSGRMHPSPGLHRIPSNFVYSCSANSPIQDVSDPFVRQICTGWKGTGSVPPNGTETNVTFTPLQASSIEWQWEKQMRLGGGSSGGTELWIPVSASSPWFAVDDASAPDGSSFRSGDVDQDAASVLETTVLEPGRLSFAWRIDANRGDYARFYLDGAKTNEITRSQPWSTNEVLLAAGEHSLRWTFERGSSAGGAAFLDDVRWCPLRTLTVESAIGEPSPETGMHEVFWGDVIAAGVASPVTEAGGGTRRVCTGWRGTGSTPPSGEGTNVTFTVEEDSSLSWNWKTEHWIDVAVSSGGSTSFRPQWIADGDTVEIQLSPTPRLYEIALTGDTGDGVSLDGTILRVTADRQRRIRATITERKLSLAVSSSDGTATPAPGIHLLSWGDRVTASVTEPPMVDGTRRACLGWLGTGSVPANGEGTEVSFTMEDDSTLSWRWRTEHWIAVETEGPLETDFRTGWRAADGTLAMNYDVLFDGGCEVTLGGDTNGVVLVAASRTVLIPCDRVRSLLLSARLQTPDGPSLAEALDAPGLAWTSLGANRWMAQNKMAADGEDAAESGDASGDDSILATEVTGPGTLSWSWRLAAAGTAGIDLEIDRTGPWCSIERDQAGEWIENSVDIAGDGTHEVRFVFWNESGTASDRGWVDRVSWSGALAGVRETASTPAPVPYRWLVQKGLVSEGSQDAEFELAANAPAKNGRPVWECYVADLDPTKDDDFIARIEMADGEPRVSWIPSNAVGRIYRVYGKTALADGWSRPASPAHRFFQVRVALQNESADAFQGPVEVTFDADGGTVDPTKRIYTQPGILGALPVPSRDGFTFLGWWTRETGGVRVSENTPVPWSDWTFHARWE